MYVGTDLKKDSRNHTIEYDPVFQTLVKQGDIPPVFSFALERGTKGGYLALGGLPPVKPSGPWAKTPILISTSKSHNPKFSRELAFYTVEVDSYQLAKTGGQLEASKNGKKTKVILDTGTTLAIFPDAVAKELAASFDPPAQFSKDDGVYWTKCDAQVPKFGIEIGGQVFNIHPADLLYHGDGFTNSTTNECVVGFVGGDFYVFGDTFLNNVISVFDVGAAEVRLAQHIY